MQVVLWVRQLLLVHADVLVDRCDIMKLIFMVKVVLGEAWRYQAAGRLRLLELKVEVVSISMDQPPILTPAEDKFQDN